MQLETLYRHRFSDRDRAEKQAVWQVLCEDFFSRYIPPEATVLDLGAGYCEFINNVRAGRRIAIDANPELARCAGEGVEAHNRGVDDLTFVPDRSVDVVFCSNLLEHLPDKTALSSLIGQVHRILDHGGRFLVMGPNVKYLPGKYWDYYDHHIPLTEKSLDELLSNVGFEVEECLPRFMPYTVKSRLPKWPWLVRNYLRLGAVSFPLFGKQFFVVGRKP